MQELYAKMAEQWEIFKSEHEKAVGGNRSAASRARKAIGELRKCVTGYRKASVEENKKK